MPTTISKSVSDDVDRAFVEGAKMSLRVFREELLAAYGPEFRLTVAEMVTILKSVEDGAEEALLS